MNVGIEPYASVFPRPHSSWYIESDPALSVKAFIREIEPAGDIYIYILYLGGFIRRT